MTSKSRKDAQPPNSRCPDNSAFRQQKLSAWQPKLTPASVLSGFILISVFCLTMGVCLILSAKSVKEVQINYSDKCLICSKLRENSSNWNTECLCSADFKLEEKIQGDVFMYYGLQNFYQNHRRYVMSRSNAQLLGRNTDIHNSNCAPFSTYRNGTPMAPCGAIANSMFNDTISLFYYTNLSTAIQVPLLKTGNSWWTDKYVKFRNPTSHNLTSAFAGTAKPPYWQKPAYLLDEENERNNGYINDDFIIWMRVSAFHTFRNLHRRLSRTEQFADGLPAGNYTFRIFYNFPVSRFKGKKYLILSTVVWCGGSSLFLGIAYTVSGAVVMLAGFIITAIHLMVKKRKTYFQR
ncbi:PREDICTED: cell cycle control protein 50C-like isoform X1 [Crocodylus porosus]|uniref:cell cycle control protein 50C-like isoform X1 n=1 Tax=Crocodylus porosus TaxID=8502 RepID=UPI00093BD66D|nr:PREDICTED: cell cycle control protein 50C-like isoform X1 [Crocodylus porosus]